MICSVCNEKTTRQNRISYHIRKLLGIDVCKKCQKEKYKMITQTTALQRYKVPKAKLLELRYVKNTNPNFPASASMKLFLENDVKELMFKKVAGKILPDKLFTI